MPSPRQQPRDRWLRRRPDLRGAARSARLERTLVHVHAAILGAYVVVTAAPLLWTPSGVVGPAARVALALVFAAVATDLLRRGERMLHLGVLTAALGLAVALESVQRPVDLGPDLAFSAVAISGARLLRLVPFSGALLVLGGAFSVVMSLSPGDTPLLQHLDAALLGAALSVSIAGFVGTLEEGARTAERLDEVALARERTLHRERSAEHAAAAAGRVLHDEVLTSLRLVAESAEQRLDPDAVRASCRASARSVREETRPVGPADHRPDARRPDPDQGLGAAQVPAPTSLGEVLDDVASRAGVVTRLEGTPRTLATRLPRAGAEALARALGETLRNVARHSGTVEASLRVTRTGPRVLVEVVDHGRGLPAGAVEGFGLQHSVRAALTAAGGDVEVVPTPGGGVTVRLGLPRAATVPASRPRPWSRTDLARCHRLTVLTSGGEISLVRAVAWPQGLAWTYLALRYSWDSSPVVLALGLLAVLVAVTVGVAERLERRPPTLGWVLRLVVLLVVVQVVGLSVLPPGGMLDYRSWTIGFVAVPVMTACFFLPRTLGLLVLAPHPVAVLVAVALDPALTLGLPPLGSLNATLLTPLLGVVLGGLLRRSGHQVEAERERLSRAQRALARRRARAEVTSVHLRHTRTVVVPWLEDVARSRLDLHDPLTAETARALSWEVRDDLYAPGFFDPELRGLVTEARRRGAAVEVGAGFAPGAADRTTGELLRELAPRLAPGTKLTVATRAGHARLALVPPDPELVRCVRRILPAGLSVDSDEFRAVIRYDDAPRKWGVADDRATG